MRFSGSVTAPRSAAESGRSDQANSATKSGTTGARVSMARSSGLRSLCIWRTRRATSPPRSRMPAISTSTLVTSLVDLTGSAAYSPMINTADAPARTADARQQPGVARRARRGRVVVHEPRLARRPQAVQQDTRRPSGPVAPQCRAAPRDTCQDTWCPERSPRATTVERDVCTSEHLPRRPGAWPSGIRGLWVRAPRAPRASPQLRPPLGRESRGPATGLRPEAVQLSGSAGGARAHPLRRRRRWPNTFRPPRRVREVPARHRLPDLAAAAFAGPRAPRAPHPDRTGPR